MNHHKSTSPSLKPAAAIVLQKGPKIWLGHRGQSRFLPGFWVFPGGVCEAGESFLQTALRELNEETGLQLSPEITVHPFARAITPAYSRYRYDVMVYRCELPEGLQPVPDGVEFVDGVWLSPSEALRLRAEGEMQLAPPTYRQIRSLQECLSGEREWPDESVAFADPPRRNEDVLPLCRGLTIVPVRARPLPPASWTNTALIGERRLLILDPGGLEQEVLQSEIRRHLERGHEIEGVLLSHHHPDHLAGYHDLGLSHLPLYCHEATAELLPTGFPSPVLLNDGQELFLEPDLTVVAHHCPGHAPGHLAFELRECRALLAGDMISSLSSIVLPPDNGDLSDYLASLLRLRSLQCHLTVPAHGPPYGKGSDPFKEAFQHREKRESQILSLLKKAPRSVEEITTLLYRGLDPRLVTAAHCNVGHHLKKLEAEGVAAQQDAQWTALPIEARGKSPLKRYF